MALHRNNQQPHRGRFQAQGNGLQESEPWAQSLPLTHADGLILLNQLENKLIRRDRLARQAYFQIWRNKIAVFHQKGGYDATTGGQYIKSEPKGAAPDEPRVDLEIRTGQAFI